MSALGQKQTLQSVRPMSALPRKRPGAERAGQVKSRIRPAKRVAAGAADGPLIRRE